MAHISEYEVEKIFIDRLESIGYKFIKLGNYADVLDQFPRTTCKVQCKETGRKRTRCIVFRC